MRIFYPVFCEENGHRPAAHGGQKICGCPQAVFADCADRTFSGFFCMTNVLQDAIATVS
ncbi:hypothetical protein [Roseovarius indicus]|uniref:hypothetical protein n=1 Tax=Roseovarius indicus TaxID=540747 RepID=UPI0032ECF84E